LYQVYIAQMRENMWVLAQVIIWINAFFKSRVQTVSRNTDIFREVAQPLEP
jgi:hypothetical protein